LLFILQQLGLSIGYASFTVFGEFALGAFVVINSGIFLLMVAELWPASDDDSWGSMWPLVGYDNAVDAICTRGPWLMRSQEADEAERVRELRMGFSGSSPSDRHQQVCSPLKLKIASMLAWLSPGRIEGHTVHRSSMRACHANSAQETPVTRVRNRETKVPAWALL